MLSLLRFERLKRGWTQFHLSMLSGIPQYRLSYAERGFAVLSRDQKKQLSEIFERDEKDLFSEVDHVKFPPDLKPRKENPS